MYSVETRLSASLADGRRIDDFVAGAGSTPEEAFLDSLNNFCLTTLHPIYAEIVDHNDPHVYKEKWTVGGGYRNVFLLEWGVRGEVIEASVKSDVQNIIANEMLHINVSNGMHWAKLVVANISGKMSTLVFTLDGKQVEEINRKLSAYKWPKSDQFYMAKLFFVIGKV